MAAAEVRNRLPVTVDAGADGRRVQGIHWYYEPVGAPWPRIPGCTACAVASPTWTPTECGGPA